MLSATPSPSAESVTLISTSCMYDMADNKKDAYFIGFFGQNLMLEV